MSFQTTDENSVETRLREAGTRRSAVRPLDEVGARARQLRRRRRSAQAGGMTLLAAGVACAVVLTPTLRPGTDGAENVAANQGGSVQKADRVPAEKEPCTTSFGNTGDFSDVPELLYLPSAAVGGTPALTFVRMDSSTCKPDPLALVAYQAGTGGAGKAGLKIHGPGARNPHDAVAAPGEPDAEFGGTVLEDPAAPGHLTQYLMDVADGRELPFEAYWTDPAGQSWFFETYGFESGDLTDLVKGLDTRGGKVDPKSLPEELTSWRVAGGINPDDYPDAGFTDDRDLIQPDQKSWWWAANYDKGAGWTFEASRNKNLIEYAATHPGAKPLQLKVLGESREALWIEDLDKLVWELPDGAVASVVGQLGLEESKRVAESLTKVKADDPALVETREKTPRNIPKD